MERGLVFEIIGLHLKIFKFRTTCWKPVISANSKQKYDCYYIHTCRLLRSCPIQNVWAVRWEMLHVVEGAATFMIQIPLAALLLPIVRDHFPSISCVMSTHIGNS